MFSENSNSTKKFSFTLERSDFKKSIFCGVNSYEVVNPEMCNGFIVNKMGIKFHKTGKFKNMPYKNEQELFISYQKNYIGNSDKVKLAINCTYLHTYLLTYLPTYIPTYLPTYLLTYIGSYLE